MVTSLGTIRPLGALLAVALVAGLTAAPPAGAQIAVSSNDNKVVLVDGVTTGVASAPADTATILDLSVSPPKVLAEIEVPGSVVGPPFSVAITPDEGLALVTSSTKLDPADPKKQLPDNKLTVIDLKASPPAIIARLEAGKGAAGVSINRQGTLALVANRAEGTVSVFSISGKTVTPVEVVKLGDEKSGPCHVAITPDGRMALVTRDGDHMISVLSISGTKVEHAKRDITAGVRPYGIDINAAGTLAVAANMSRSAGDSDSLSVIDLQANPARVVATVGVPQSPEGLLFSPDGKLLAVAAMDGSNKPRNSPFFGAVGKLLLFRVDSATLTKVAEAPIGRWSQGVAFSADGKTLLVQNMVEKEIWVFAVDGTALRDTGQRIKVNGGPAAIRIADKPR